MSSTLATFAPRSALGTWRTFKPYSMFSATLMCGKSA